MEQQNENRQNPQRRVVRRRRVRYDRIAIALALLILVIVLFFSCSCSCIRCICSPTEEKDGVEAATTTSDIIQSDESSEGQLIDETLDNAAMSLTLSADDMAKGSLVVVNADTQYKFPTDDSTLVNVYEKRNASYKVSTMDVQLDETAVNQLNLFLSEFSTLYGKTDVQVESGYRSKQDQDTRYSNGSSIFPGGYSDYHTGRSFDLCIAPEDGMQSYYVASGDYAWINQNAYKYGFILRYPEGKIDSTGVNPRSYTFHYVGEPHAKYMNDNNLCLEEYVEAMKEYPATAPLKVDTESGVWTVFYVEMEASGNSVINIPACQEYTISGDNLGGFIVAYK